MFSESVRGWMTVAAATTVIVVAILWSTAESAPVDVDFGRACESAVVAAELSRSEPNIEPCATGTQTAATSVRAAVAALSTGPGEIVR